MAAYNIASLMEQRNYYKLGKSHISCRILRFNIMCKIIISSISECMCSSQRAVEGIETAGTKNQNEPVGHALHFAILEPVTSPIYSYGFLVVVVDISSAVEVRCSPAKFRSP